MTTDTTLSAQALARRLQVMPLSWNGPFVPQLGQRVRVTSPDRGHGRVVGFFAADRQLGVQVHLELAPGPWRREVVDQGRALVFGHQIEQADSE